MLILGRKSLRKNEVADLFNRLKDEWNKSNQTEKAEFLERLRGVEAHVYGSDCINARQNFRNASMSQNAEPVYEGTSLPVTAPKLWSERSHSEKTNPAKFIRDVYGDWLDKGLTRAIIGKLDMQLYQAYASWISPNRHPEDRIFPEDGLNRQISVDTAEERGIRERRQSAERQARFRVRRSQAESPQRS